MLAHHSRTTIHSAQFRTQAPLEMLEHLLDYNPPLTSMSGVTPLDKAAPDEILAAQVSTADWLKEMGAPTADEAEQTMAAADARQAFQALSTLPAEQQRAALVKIKTPLAVRHLTGMLTAYDWEFVEQAKELRGYAVAQILEETKNPDAKIRLKALDMLGRVTEVALFTERVEIKKTDMSDGELDQRIKDKLARFMNVTDVSEVEEVDTVDAETPNTTPDEPPAAN